MPFVPAPNIVMVEVRAEQAGQKIENRIMVNMLAAPTGAAISDLVDTVRTWAEGTLFLNVCNNVALTEIVGTDLSVANGQQVTQIATPGTVGQLGDDPMPNEVAYCVSLRSTSRGRSARGRWYMYGLDKEVVVENNVTGPYRTAVTGAIQSLIDVITGTGVLPVIVSYVANKAPRPGGPVYFPITTAVTVDATVDSMRKRKPGVGT